MTAQTPVQPFADLAENESVTTTTGDGTAVLVAARCSVCGTGWFPRGAVCPSCAAADPEQFLVGSGGTLYSFTTVHVSASRPTPYTLGFVDLDEGIRVLATIESEGVEPEVNSRCSLHLGEDGTWSFIPEAGSK